MTTNPGTPQPLWMYVRLPSGFGSTSVLNVTAYEAVESGTIREGERPALEAGKVIGAVRLVRPPVMPLRTDGLIGLVGARSMGLRNYEAPTTQWTWLPGGHEPLRIIARLDAETLPDRWMGLEPYEAIVWSEGSPTSATTGWSTAA